MDIRSHPDIASVLLDAGLGAFGVCPYDAVAGRLRPCRAAAELAALRPRSVIMAAFPYRFPDRPEDEGAVISRYARVPDYHEAAGGVLRDMAGRLTREHPGYTFRSFIDNSPLPEVYAAAAAGLGVVGRHGLLITPAYGSWVSLGAVVTDLPLSYTADGAAADSLTAEATEAAERAGSPAVRAYACRNCGLCAAACPAGCIDAGTREACLSALSQKKGALTPEEAERLRRAGTAWGCDACQEACPLNRGVRIAPHPCFDGEYAGTPDPARLAGRAYAWRGRAVIERNLRLLGLPDRPAEENGTERSAPPEMGGN